MNLAKPGETCTGSLVAHYYTYVGTDSRGVPEYIKAKMKAFRHEDHAAHEHDSFMYGPAWCTGWDDEREEAARESTTE